MTTMIARKAQCVDYGVQILTHTTFYDGLLNASIEHIFKKWLQAVVFANHHHFNRQQPDTEQADPPVVSNPR